ncbi:MAG: DUF975 family protein [Spirochaetes bacterium]|nr:DUF975 family protein [Spirochaetota bacterium]
MRENHELRAIARSQLHGSWLAAVGIVLVYGVIISASSFVVVGPLVLGGPLTLGLIGYFLKKARGGTGQLENLFDGFSSFVKSFLLYLLQVIFIGLWSLLFIIPGIVKSFSYSMAFFILHDNPDIGASEAIDRSKKMMNGYKGKLFGLCLSFLGWGILCCFTLGIGFLWLFPYMSLSVTNFYEDLKKNQPANVSNTAE